MGANSQFTPSTGSNYQNVDEMPPNNDTDYNKALSAGLLDTFPMTDFTLPADHVIRAVIPVTVVRKTDAALDSKVKLHAYDGSTYQKSSAIAVTTSYGEYFVRFTLQNDGSSWNQDDLNSYQFGYESYGAF